MPRYMKRNQGTESPSNLIFFDTESIAREYYNPLKVTSHTLRLWCATRVRLEKGQTTRRKEATGNDSNSFWEFILNNSDPEHCTWIFAHNLAFDLTMTEFWAELDSGRFTTLPMKSKSLGTDGQSKNSWIGKLCLDQSPTWLQVRQGKRTYKIVDSMNYWHMSLEKLGSCYCLQKVPLPEQSDDNGKWLERCRQDVKILEVAIVELIQRWRELDLGVFQPTAASLAETNFRHTCPIVTPGDKTLDILPTANTPATKLERECYYGGRIQAFYVGERLHQMYHIDCNSLYPYVMRNNSFPRRFVEYINEPSVTEAEAKAKVYGLCARLRIESRTQTYPVRIDSKQYHCCGQYWTSLCGIELQRAISSGSVGRIGLLQVYSIAPIFRHWVDEWYRRKTEASRMGDAGIGDRELSKLILNSLSGKFAQHGRHWKECPGQYPLVRWGGYPEQSKDGKRIVKCRGIAGAKQQLEDSREPDNAFPAISAFITSYAREYMREVIGRCPEGSVYYMATDSLICGPDAMDVLHSEGYLSDDELGKFKVIGESEYCNIVGPNDYVLGAKQVLSGHAGKAVLGRNGALSVELWDRMPSVIADGPKCDIKVTTVPAFYPSHTNRGKIRDDGYWEPYRLTDDVWLTDRPRQGGYFSGDSPDREAPHIQLT